MAEIAVKVVYHIKIDTAKQSIGMIDYPEKVLKTVSVGDEIAPGEAVLVDVLTGEDMAFVDEKLKTRVEESLRKAKVISQNKETGSIKSDLSHDENVNEEENQGEGDMSLF